MRRRVIHLFVAVLVCSFSAFAESVVEVESSANIQGTNLVVDLVAESDVDTSTLASVEMVNTDGVVKMSADPRSFQLHSGKQVVEFQLALPSNLQSADLPWYRLRYKVGNSSGVISMTQLLRDLFEIRVIATSYVLPGMGYRIRVRTANPFTDLPAGDVDIETTVSLDLADDKIKKLELKGSGKTDGEGFAVVDLSIPVGAMLDGDGTLKVDGRKNGIVRQAEKDVRGMPDDVTCLPMTDKPIYQPDQTVNIRSIHFKGIETKMVLANTPFEYRIADEDGTVLYKQKVRSSLFGITMAAWRIPAAAKLGSYRIEVLDGQGEIIGDRRVRVSRYDLPNFVVAAKPQKPFYLVTDSTALVEVRADYLFGKPVTKGKVRIVEETNREWNWKEQKYDIDEGQVREGELGGDGKFVARFDISAVRDDLKDDDYRLYRDIKLAAYVTDASTNKTEQRHFDIRVSRDPIHVYFNGETYRLDPSMPIDGYVSTFYADGTPAECDVEIRASADDERKYRTVGRLTTSKFGAGKFSIARPKIGDPDDSIDMRLVASDRKGLRGTSRADELHFDPDETALRLTTDHVIYKPGETMTVSLESTKKSGLVYLDVLYGWTVVDSRFAQLKDGRATIAVPYRKEFKGPLNVAAFTEKGEDDEFVSVSHGVLFPSRRGLNVEANFDKALYKPNEESVAQFSVFDPTGQGVESALGIVVVDKAVEERARTDADFGGMWKGYQGLLGTSDNFGGITVKTLNDLDLSKPIPEEMQTVAGLLLSDSYYDPEMFHSPSYATEASSVFGVSIHMQFARVTSSLRNAYERNVHPVDDTSLREILKTDGIDIDSFRDPWGQQFVFTYSVEQTRDIVTARSAGPDKRIGTKDDFTAYSDGFEYFKKLGERIDVLVKNYNDHTGEFIRDEKTLFSELGVPELRDRFGLLYRVTFTGEGRYLDIRIVSAGPDGKFEKDVWGNDDFNVWTSRIDSFSKIESRIRASQSGLSPIPTTEAEFRKSLKRSSIDFDTLRDASGQKLYITVTRLARYSDKPIVENRREYGDTMSTQHTVITPVTQEIVQFTIRGPGLDGAVGTSDDVTLLLISHVISERSKDDLAPTKPFKGVAFRAGTGAVGGSIKDPNGAIVPGATIKVSRDDFSKTATTNDSGTWMIAGLNPGTYQVTATAQGFVVSTVKNVPVKADQTTQLDIVLSVGAVMNVVDVAGDSGGLAMTSTTEQQQSNVTITGRQITATPDRSKASDRLPQDPDRQERSTPRLREYFPETLFWAPEIVTDANGQAQVKFRMADNITTWKLYSIASTKDGMIGVGEKEVAAFQSFFADLDPPKFLTEGDEIYLPAEVRNYTEKKQRVDVSMDNAPWFSLLTAGKQQIDVASNSSQNAVFGFRATKAIDSGKQRVTAIGQTDSDAIERPVTVRPNGEEIVRSASRFSTGGQTFDLKFPPNSLPGTQHAVLKIYPNLYAHVAESVEGLVERPYGCGEQTISSTYPNLMVLKFVKPDSAIAAKANKYLQAGYERLLGYQTVDGGFSYWGPKDSPNVALTAYAIRFLSDARSMIEVDPEVADRGVDWLLKQQRADGSWTDRHRYETTEDPKQTSLFTAYVARILAMHARDAKPREGDALQHAFEYLKLHIAESDEPYVLALYGLAMTSAGDDEGARKIADRLEKKAIFEDGGAYWNLETNTPFYGWGTAGRIETTALVMQLLIAANNNVPDPSARDLSAKATVFLLKNKDRLGVWYSTQTTINVLDAFLASLSGSHGQARQHLAVVFNGRSLDNIDIAPDQFEAQVIDLTGKLDPTSNTIEIQSSEPSALMTQVVASHYIDWRDSQDSRIDVNRSRALRLDYKCDRLNAAIMQEITCSVEAERVGFRGYGMLLAEIGIPPGADVSRESLEKATENNWSISRYEVLPDRIVFYMWSAPGGTKFNFKFKTRYGINAQTPPSTVYDYYNPEAQATVAPLRFTIK